MDKDIISFRGERDVWLDFTHKVKKQKKEVWEILKPLLLKWK